MIERTFDYRRIKRIVYWQPIISSELIYLVESNGQEDIGLWSFNKYLSGFQIHADMTINCRGQRAVESAVNAFKWIFENTKIEIIYAGIVFDKREASFIAIRSGMKYTHSENGYRFYEVKRWDS